jgi:hypothetical protein
MIDPRILISLYPELEYLLTGFEVVECKEYIQSLESVNQISN